MDLTENVEQTYDGLSFAAVRADSRTWQNVDGGDGATKCRTFDLYEYQLANRYDRGRRGGN